MKLENKARLRRILVQIGIVKSAMKEYDFTKTHNGLEKLEGQIQILADKTRMNEVSEVEEE